MSKVSAWIQLAAIQQYGHYWKFRNEEGSDFLTVLPWMFSSRELEAAILIDPQRRVNLVTLELRHGPLVERDADWQEYFSQRLAGVGYEAVLFGKADIKVTRRSDKWEGRHIDLRLDNQTFLTLSNQPSPHGPVSIGDDVPYWITSPIPRVNESSLLALAELCLIYLRSKLK